MLYLDKGSWYISDLGAESKKDPINLNAISIKKFVFYFFLYSEQRGTHYQDINT